MIDRLRQDLSNLDQANQQKIGELTESLHEVNQKNHLLIKQLSTEWPASSYDVLRRNCVTFAVTLCRHLGVERHIPPEYSRFAEFGAGWSGGSCRAAPACRGMEPSLSCTTAREDQEDDHTTGLLEVEPSGIVQVVPLHPD